ncbi:MAG: diaminopimelate decarboxylase, partial [Oscillospiraceae bacterium]
MFNIKDNQLFIDGNSAELLAKKYGTPLLVMSRPDIIAKCDEIKRDFLQKYPHTRAAYAGKAFLTLGMCKIMEEVGFCLDVVSGGELFTALKAGFPPERIEFNGNNKGIAEIDSAVFNNVGRIIIDGSDELELIEAAAKKYHKRVNVLIRISPGVDSHTHQYITTGQLDSKFGVPLFKESFHAFFKKVLASPFVKLLGFHFHVGSQLLENSSHLMAAAVILDLIKELRQTVDFAPVELNIGGGFGIKYTDEDKVPPYSYFLDPVMELIYKSFDSMNLPHPAVVIEPGRSIVGEAGTTLYTVGTIKDIPNIRK